MSTLPAFCRMAERTRVFRAAVAAGALLLVCQAASAAVIAFTGGSTTTDLPNRTLGYQFTTGNGGLLVSTLGYWDEGSNGLAEAHQVGIWTDRDRTLVALATVTAGTTAWLDDGHFGPNMERRRRAHRLAGAGIAGPGRPGVRGAGANSRRGQVAGRRLIGG